MASDEAGRTNRDEGVGPQSRHALQPLPLETNQAAEQHGHPEADGNLLRLHCSSRPWRADSRRACSRRAGPRLR
ncbi:MAG TPA: hypothetical protein VH230_02605, partial [Stellaceae bacterium]|nr:hypothetical protein [Stellaceae bacterium]